MSVMVEGKEYLTSKEVCEKYSICKSNLFYMRSRGIPFIVVGKKKFLYPVKETDEWIISENTTT